MEEEDDEDPDVEIINNDNKYINKANRITRATLFNYERVRLLSDRAAQLAAGAIPMIKDVSHLDVKVIAKLELESKKIPLYIEREIPGGKIEKWHVYELTNTNMELLDENNNNTFKIIKTPIQTLLVNKDD